MTTQNEPAERLRDGLEAIRDTSTDSASRQLADSLLALLETHDAAERHRAYSEGMDDGRLVEQAACREKVAAERRAFGKRVLANFSDRIDRAWGNENAAKATDLLRWAVDGEAAR